VDLQVVRHEELTAKAQQYTQRTIRREPRRGDILDARGNLLATSVFVKTVCADPTLLLGRQAELARAIAPILGLDEAFVYQRMLPRTYVDEDGATNQFKSIRLKQKVPTETWVKLQETMRQLQFGVDESKLPRKERQKFADLRTRGIFCEPVDDQLRTYPNQRLAAHVLGYVGFTPASTNHPDDSITVGVEGVERAFNSKLTGVNGWLVTETDSRRRELAVFREQNVAARDGLNVVLTIDSVVQHVLEAALAEAMEKHTPISASGIVLRPSTGEILGMASLPSFDPNRLAESTPDTRRNRNITDIVEPGSTFKIVVVSGALDESVVTLRDVFDCEHGQFVFGGRVLHDHDPYDRLTVESIITKSSNIGSAKIGIKLGADKLYEHIRAYGFGARTGIPLPGEVPGILHPVNKWSKVSIAQIPMGHGIAVTRLQMAMAMAALANDGRLMRPMLVKRLEDRTGHTVVEYTPQCVRQVVSTNAARDMVKALKTVVTKDGTAPKAELEHYTVAGKTGTAQKVENGAYVRGKYISSFIGFFPADQAELCISIVLDEPKQGYYGGQTAAPIFKSVAESCANYLNIRPDREVAEPGAATPIVSNGSAPSVRRVAARNLNPEKP
jgi:cell division protein FtsI/penicillin-binding protein 2